MDITDTKTTKINHNGRTYVYVIKNEFGLYYTGITKDITIRIKQHNSKKCKSTMYANVWTLVLYEIKDTRKEAAILERYIKNLGANKYLLKIKYSPNVTMF